MRRRSFVLSCFLSIACGCSSSPDQIGTHTRGSPTETLQPPTTIKSTQVRNSQTASTTTPDRDNEVWDRFALTFDGPSAKEAGMMNPMTHYSLDVTFSGPSGQHYRVPGHFAADGQAGETGATEGSVWRVYFSPDEVGPWSYEGTLRSGGDAALRDNGSNSIVGQWSGGFRVSRSDKPPEDFRRKGRLEYVGSHYLEFAGTNERFVKNGAGSPENFLGYSGFDGTPDTHSYEPHIDDWSSGDPVWRDGLGKGIIGAVNYLAQVGVNSQYMVLYNTDGGDGDDVWPWVARDEKTRYDVSKLDQWERVFTHMTSVGVMPHMLFRETENDRVMNDGNLGRETRVYYREIVSRFAHHPAVVWNLGEETNLSLSQLREHAQFLRRLDPYDHPIVVHNRIDDQERLYGDLVGNPNFEGTSLQDNNDYTANERAIRWRRHSAEAGRPWAVMIDEMGRGWIGLPCDGETVGDVDQSYIRRQALWPGYLGGAAGLSWYMGHGTCGGDNSLEDFRTRDRWWRWTKVVHEIIKQLPLEEMEPQNSRIRGGESFLFGGPTVKLAYSRRSLPLEVDLPEGTWSIEWIDPTSGRRESTLTVNGGGWTDIAKPSFNGDVAMILRAE